MNLSRRDFLRISGVATGGLLLPTGAALASGAYSYALHKPVGETPTICCFCGVGCGAIVSAKGGIVLNVEGDPDHPINQGSLCSKGLAIAQLNTVDGKPNPRRLKKPLYRAPNATKWEEKSWNWVIDTIARRVKATRDNNWNTAASRTDALASFGGGELDNEECYLLSKMNRALGMVFLEHCARI